MGNRISLDADDAIEFGLNAAMLLSHISFWIYVNRKDKRKNSFQDGHWWTYDSVKKYAEHFKFMSARQIQLALEKLEEKGVIVVGNYNQKGYDRTKWYRVVDTKKYLNRWAKYENDRSDPYKHSFNKNVKSIQQKCEMDLTSTLNGFNAHVEPIPDITTNIKADITHTPDENSDRLPASQVGVSAIDCITKETSNSSGEETPPDPEKVKRQRKIAEGYNKSPENKGVKEQKKTHEMKANISTLIDLCSAAAISLGFPSHGIAVYGRHGNSAKILIKAFGFKESKELTEWTIKNWKEAKKKLKIGVGYPTPGVMDGFSPGLLDLKKNGIKSTSGSNRQWTDDSLPEGEVQAKPKPIQFWDALDRANEKREALEPPLEALNAEEEELLLAKILKLYKTSAS